MYNQIPTQCVDRLISISFSFSKRYQFILHQFMICDFKMSYILYTLYTYKDHLHRVFAIGVERLIYFRQYVD